MATGMFGANTDELRRVSDEFDLRTSVVQAARMRTAREVEASVWVGHDADAFKQRYSNEVAALMERLEQTLIQYRADLSKQAEEQDECSRARGGDGRSFWQRVLDGLKDLARGVGGAIGDLIDTIRDRVSVDVNGPGVNWSLKIPGFSHGRHVQGGREFENGQWQDVDPKIHGNKWTFGLRGAFDLFSASASADLPGGYSIDGFVGAGANAFLGYDMISRGGTPEHKVGVSLGVSADAGASLSKHHGGYLSTSVGVYGTVGASVDAKVQFGTDNGKLDLSARAKAAAGLGGGFSGGLSYDYGQAWSDLRNDPGTFFENSGKDLVSVAGGSLSTASPVAQAVIQHVN